MAGRTFITVALTLPKREIGNNSETTQRTDGDGDSAAAVCKPACWSRQLAAKCNQSIAYTPYACGAQRALLSIAVGSMNIKEFMNINDVRESSTIFPHPAN